MSELTRQGISLSAVDAFEIPLYPYRLLNRLQLPVGSRYTIRTSGNTLEGYYCPKDIAVILSKLFAAGISWLNHTKSFQINHGKKVANYKKTIISAVCKTFLTVIRFNRRKRRPLAQKKLRTIFLVDKTPTSAKKLRTKKVRNFFYAEIFLCFIRRSLILLMNRSGATAFTIGPKLSTRIINSVSSSAS